MRREHAIDNGREPSNGAVLYEPKGGILYSIYDAHESFNKNECSLMLKRTRGRPFETRTRS